MAYRQSSDRRDRASESYASSYLDDFLDQIDPLQSSTKASFAEIRHLDDRIANILIEAQGAAEEAVRRATSKIAIESVRRQYHEFIHLQASAKEFSDKKIALAEAAHVSVTGAISDLDTRLVEFEAQLRKEGRWPGAAPPPQRAVPAPEKLTAPTRLVTPAAPSTRGTQKSRRRESSASANPATARVAALAARAARDSDVVMTEEDSISGIAPTDRQAKEEAMLEAAAKTQLYCVCRAISHGSMVACEEDNCPYEWFHFECVGLTEEPKGVWYCPTCSKNLGEKKKKTTRRKN